MHFNTELGNSTHLDSLNRDAVSVVHSTTPFGQSFDVFATLDNIFLCICTWWWSLSRQEGSTLSMSILFILFIKKILFYYFILFNHCCVGFRPCERSTCWRVASEYFSGANTANLISSSSPPLQDNTGTPTGWLIIRFLFCLNGLGIAPLMSAYQIWGFLA